MPIDIDWSDALVSVIETALGAGLGFWFGIKTLKRQQRVEAAEREEATFSECVSVVARAQRTAVMNIETLAVLKLTATNAVVAENSTLEPLIVAFDKAAIEEKGNAYTGIEQRLYAMRQFFVSLPTPTLMPFPDFREFDIATNDMPYFAMFIQRAAAQNIDLVATIKERNSLIAEYAGENSHEMYMARKMYFAQMLSGSATAIEHYVDFALAFNLLVKKQADSYLLHYVNDRKVLLYDINERGKSALPAKDEFPEMTAQITDFSKLPPRRKA